MSKTSVCGRYDTRVAGDVYPSEAAVGNSVLKCLQVSAYTTIPPKIPTEMNLDTHLYTELTVSTRLPLPVVGTEDLAEK